MRVKQKNIHTSRANWSAFRDFASVWTLSIGLAAISSGAQAAPDPGVPTSKLRIVSEAGPQAGSYRAGIEISMSAGAHTYWKVPGEAGVPPVFSFDRSTNVARAEVLYPVPTRMSEEGLEAFGYTGKVVFPVIVTPRDPAKPTQLTANVTYAICGKLCIPAHNEAEATLSPAKEAVDAGAVRTAFATVPKALPVADKDKLKVSVVAAGGEATLQDVPTWQIAWHGRLLNDLFVVAPDGYYFVTKPDGRNRWKLTLVQSVAAKEARKIGVQIVLADGDKSLKAEERLDVPPSAQ